MAMKVGELFAEVDVRKDKFNKGIGKMQNALASKLGVSSAAVGAAAAGLAIVGVAAAAAAAKGIKEFAAFEKKLFEVFTLIPDASEEMKNKMTEDIREFSVEMGVATNESLPALYQALSAGVPKDNVFNFLEDAQKLAVGGVANLEDSVGVLSTAVNNYAEEGLTAKEASDKLFTAVKNGITTIPELATTLGKVIPNAAELGISFGEVTGSMATLTSLMGKGSTAEAVTRLRGMLNELAKSGSKANEAFKKAAGVGLREFLEQGGTLTEAMVLLKEHANETGVSVANMFGAQEAGSAAVMLTEQIETQQENMKGMNESAGATQEAYDQMEESLSRSFDKIGTAVNDVWLEIGTQLAPVMKDLADWIIANMPEIKNIVGTVFEFIGKVIGLVGPVIGETLAFFIKFFDIVATVVSAVMNPFETVKKFLQAFSLYDIGVDIIQGLVDGIRNKMMAPVRLIQGIAGMIKDAAMTALGMGSPSKEFEKIGYGVTEGFREGIKKTEQLAADQVAGMMRNTLSQPELAGGGGGPQVIRMNVTYNVSDRETAEYANNDLVSKLQERGIPGGYR